MRSFNYLGGSPYAQATKIFSGFEIDNLRAPLLAMVAVIVVLGMALSYDAYRLREARSEVADLTQTNAMLQQQQQSEIAPIAKMTSDLQSVYNKALIIRRSGRMSAERVALVGNALPLHVWLTSFHNENGLLTLAGGSRTMADVSDALTSLQATQGIIAPMLDQEKNVKVNDTSDYVQFSMKMTQTP